MMFRIPEANKHRVLTPDFLKKKPPDCPWKNAIHGIHRTMFFSINVHTAGICVFQPPGSADEGGGGGGGGGVSSLQRG